MPDNSIVRIGLKDTAWTDSLNVANFEGWMFIEINRTDVNNFSYRIAAISTLGGSSTLYNTDITGFNNLKGFIEVTNSGNNIRMALSTGSDNEETTVYADWNGGNYGAKQQSGDQGYGISNIDVMIFGWSSGGSAMDTANVDWALLSEVSVPVAPPTNETSWTKAVDFSGSSERAVQVSNNTTYNTLRIRS